MRPDEVVFDQPFGQPPVANNRIRIEVTFGQKLFPQGAVEPLIVRIVFGGMGSATVVYSGSLLYWPH